MPPPPRIVVVGSCNTDLVLRVPTLPRPGETLLGGTFDTAPGGKGANQAVAAARAGGRVSFVGRVGRDARGDEAARAFRREGINVSGLERDPVLPSGAAFIFVAGDGQNSIGVAPGSNDHVDPAQVGRAGAKIAASRVVLLQLETPNAAALAAARRARAAGALVILNPAPARPLPRSLLRLVSVLTPNETEAATLSGVRVTGPSSAARAAARLRALGAQSVIITLGSQGALVSTGAGDRLLPGIRVPVVDTTGAGDVFSGALAVALAEGRALFEAARFANAAAALSVTKRGCQASIPSRAQILKLLAR